MPARNPETATCKIKGCTRAVRTGFLCREHQRLVPLADSIACSTAVITASHNAAVKFHRKWLRDVQARVNEGAAA